MFAKLTGPERQGAFLILGAVGALGLLLALSARTDELEFHGLLIAVIAIGLFFLLIPQSFAPEPGTDPSVWMNTSTIPARPPSSSPCSGSSPRLSSAT